MVIPFLPRAYSCNRIVASSGGGSGCSHWKQQRKRLTRSTHCSWITRLFCLACCGESLLLPDLLASSKKKNHHPCVANAWILPSLLPKPPPPHRYYNTHCLSSFPRDTNNCIPNHTMPVTTRARRLVTRQDFMVVSATFTTTASAGIVRSVTELKLTPNDDDGENETGDAITSNDPDVVDMKKVATTTPRKSKNNNASAKSRIVTPPSAPGKHDKQSKKQKNHEEDMDEEDEKQPSGRGKRTTPIKLASSSPVEDESSSRATKKTKTATSSTTPAKPTTTFKAPKDWKTVYTLVQELRQDRTAPCDHSGCEALAGGDTADPRTRRFINLVALMLSSQTKDAVVAAAIQTLKHDKFLTVEAIRDMDRSKLSDYYLKSVGFRNYKARYLQETCQILLDEYNGDIPPTAAKMMELPGVGPKMAFICENAAWNVQSGIGVDTHMHRLFGLLGWVRKDAKNPEHTRKDLEAWLPKEYWKDVNLLWVGFGQEVQQEKEKILRKALECSQPLEALQLLQRCGMNVRKEAKRYELDERVSNLLSKKTEEP